MVQAKDMRMFMVETQKKMWIPQVSWIQPAGFQEGLIVELAVGKAHLQSAM